MTHASSPDTTRRAQISSIARIASLLAMGAIAWYITDPSDTSPPSQPMVL